MFVSSRKLLMAFGIEVRRSTCFPIFHGVLKTLFQHDQIVLQEALQIWKARDQDPNPQQIDGSRTASRFHYPKPKSVRTSRQGMPKMLVNDSFMCRSFQERWVTLRPFRKFATSSWILSKDLAHPLLNKWFYFDLHCVRNLTSSTTISSRTRLHLLEMPSSSSNKLTLQPHEESRSRPCFSP
jgi:hypothetical protein